MATVGAWWGGCAVWLTWHCIGQTAQQPSSRACRSDSSSSCSRTTALSSVRFKFSPSVDSRMVLNTLVVCLFPGPSHRYAPPLIACQLRLACRSLHALFVRGAPFLLTPSIAAAARRRDAATAGLGLDLGAAAKVHSADSSVFVIYSSAARLSVYPFIRLSVYRSTHL